MAKNSIVFIKLALLTFIIYITSFGFTQRLGLIVSEHRLLTTLLFCIIWLISICSMGVAAFHPRFLVRFGWAIPLSLSAAAAYGYYIVQGSEFVVFDLLNFWAARHEIDRASEFYASGFWRAGGIFLLSLVAIAMPPAPSNNWLRRTLSRSVLLPLVPIILIAGVVLYREGHGSEAMPKQFSSLSLAAIATYKMNTGNFEPRRPVSIKPTSSLVRAVVLIVDESIRADYVSLEPGNRVTPELVQSRDQWIDFGPSVSAGNCSHISNALLRFMADRRDLIRSARTNPTIWDYAKAAGYRTVFIDAQAGFIKVFGKLQNHMTELETLAIDRLYKLDSTIPSSALDDELARIVLEELKTGDRVLIYANKNGAHFPYQLDYPTSYRQEIEASGAKQMTSLLENYAKAVTWSTDRPMSHFMRTADLSDVALIYTSDHGQNLAPGRLTHCSSADSVAPEEGIVPLMVATGNTELRERFRRVATNYRGHGTHFAIAPTLLELVGYQQADVSAAYDGSLLTQLRWKPAFVSDDILGLFSKEATWHDADPLVQDNPKSPNPASDVTGTLHR